MTRGQWSANGHNTILIRCSKEIFYIDHSFSLQWQGLTGYKCSENSPESVRTHDPMAHHNNHDACNNSTCQPSGKFSYLQWAAARGCHFDWWFRTIHPLFPLVGNIWDAALGLGKLVGVKHPAGLETALMFRGSGGWHWRSSNHCLTLRFGCSCCDGNANIRSLADIVVEVVGLDRLGILHSFVDSLHMFTPKSHTHTSLIYQKLHQNMPEMLVRSQFPWCLGRQESSNLWTPRFLNSQGRFPQRSSQSNTPNGTKHPLWYPPQRQESCLQESRFIWFPWSNWPPLHTWCRHLDEFPWYIVQQAMVQCFLLTKYNHFNSHDTSWNNFSVLQPILIQRTTFFSFLPLRFYRRWSDMFNV